MNSHQRPTSPTPDATLIVNSPLVTMLVCAVGGTVIGGLAELVWEWMTTQSWGPRIGPTKLLTVLPSPWPTIVAAAVGAGAGHARTVI
ncbi:YqeB family protein [Nonomuraea sp. H19]|uniref:YqeB family protein n=1 Tax=Nonomuraea sp. H19 TaxID=3452206 RepID=UPI003F8AA9BC